MLKNFNLDSFTNLLEQRTVGVFFDSVSASSSEGQVALELSVNLLSRLYPRIAISATGDGTRPFREALIILARQINPCIDIQETIESVDICLVIAEQHPEITAPKIYLGSEGWIARVSTECCLKAGNSKNPFGAAAAACIAAANVFRFLFSNQLEAAGLDKFLTLSLLDLNPSSSDPANPEIRSIDLGETHLVGIGAIGNGAVWALSRVLGLNGTLHLIDHETVELSNLQRYALAFQNDVETPKVSLAARHWKNNLTIHSHQRRWAQYLCERNQWHLNRVAVALDSAVDRCAVQGALPRFIINSWTRGGNLGISRHSFLGDQACLACLYMPDGRVKNEDELIAEAVGLPKASREIRQLLYLNSPVDSPLLRRIEDSLHLPPDSLLRFVGKPIRSFYAEAVCGGVLLRLGAGSNASQAEVPMAFQSVFAGILLAAEILADAGNLRARPLPTVTQLDLLKPMGTYLSAPTAKNVHRRCICQDADYIRVFQEKYRSAEFGL